MAVVSLRLRRPWRSLGSTRWMPRSERPAVRSLASFECVDCLVANLAMLGDAGRACDRSAHADDREQHLAAVFDAAVATLRGEEATCGRLVEEITARRLDAAVLANARTILDGADPVWVTTR